MQPESQLRIFLFGLLTIFLGILCFVIILQLEEKGFKVKARYQAIYQEVYRLLKKEFYFSQTKAVNQPLPLARTVQPLSNFPASQQISSAPEPKVIEDDNLFLKVQVEPKIVYPDQQILVAYDLHTRYDTRYEGFKDRGSYGGFWIEEFPLDKEVQKEEVVEKGRRYVRAIIAKRALFPMAHGRFSIRPGSFSVSYVPEKSKSGEGVLTSMYSQPGRENGILETEKVTIQVKDFPLKDQVKNFTGSSGSYEMESELIKNEDGTFTLKIRIYGRGNIRQIALPSLDFEPHFTVEKIDEPLMNLSYDKDILTGEKTFSIQLLPKSLGRLIIPSIPWSYFELEREDFQTLRTRFYEVMADKFQNRSREKESAFTATPEILFILDISGSMLAQDFGDLGDRLGVAKKILELMISHHVDKARMGVLFFARDVTKGMDLTTDLPSLRKALSAVQVGQLRDGSAYGDALLEALQTFKRHPSREKQVIVMVTDASEDNASHIESSTVADWLAERGVPVYIVALYHDGFIPFPVLEGTSGKRLVSAKINSDPQTMRSIAQRTGGRFIHITDSSQIREAVESLKPFS